MSDTDLQLLARYIRNCSEDAFAELVRRHLDLVHSAALRQVRSPQLAEEVAQSVFTDLARNARRLAPDTILTAWLYQVTRRTAIDVVRREARRQLREQIATEMNAMNATTDDWTHIEPLLDEAMQALDETDRAAVLLRYFENKSLREVGASLGASDDAAQKRVTRAVERLREFFTKRGVTVGAGGLAVVISANAVQAAPAGLAVTISTAAALAGTAITTTAATATATKAIAMTALQKTLITTIIVAAVGTGIYQARQASSLRSQVQSFQQQQMPIMDQIQKLQRDRDDAINKLASLRTENEQANRNAAELLKLRAEMTRLRDASQELAKLKATVDGDQTLSGAASWKARVNLLKQRLEQTPEARIPELRFVTEKDWLNAAKGELETDADYRRALSNLRNAGENKVASMIKKALNSYQQGNNGQSPTDLSQLQPYLDPSVDSAVLQRWQIASKETVSSLGMGGDTIITQKAAVDDVFDMCIGIGPNGIGCTDFLSREVAGTMNPVWDAFKAANNGQYPDDVSQLTPYAKTPEQLAALQKLMLSRNPDPK